MLHNILLPIAYADGVATVDSLLKAFSKHVLNPLITLVFAVALGVFIFGAVRFLVDKQNGKDDGRGPKHMMFGLLGMFIMASAFGILQLIANSLGVVADFTK